VSSCRKILVVRLLVLVFFSFALSVDVIAHTMYSADGLLCAGAVPRFRSLHSIAVDTRFPYSRGGDKSAYVFVHFLACGSQRNAQCRRESDTLDWKKKSDTQEHD